MTKAHELDRTKLTEAAARNHDDAVAPGRLMRSAALVGPNGPMPSGLIQRKARDANGVEEGAGDAVARASSSSGAALPEGLMRKFESSLGTDLSGVRVHTGSESAEAAGEVGARAYTLGQDIHFGAGHFDPSSQAGEHLLAHEVAHTVQQRGGTAHRQNKLEVSSPGDTFEVEADRAADAMVGGNAFAIAGFGGGVQRKQDDMSANVSWEAHAYDTSVGGQTNEHGKPGELGVERELFKIEQTEPLGPGLYLTVGGHAKLAAAASPGEKENAPVEKKGKVTIEETGAIGLGAGKNETKAGIEGVVSIAGSCEVVLGEDSMFKGNPAITLTGTVSLRLVAELNKEVGSSISKTLSKLELFKGHLTANGIEGQWCNKEEIIKAAEQLRDNAAATGLLGAPGAAVAAYKQRKEDEAAQKEFDDNLHSTDQQMTSNQPAQIHEKVQGYAERETDIHEQYNRQIENYKAIAEKSKGPFNHEQARDPAWWKGGAYATFNDGTVHMMNANEAYAKYKTSEGTNVVKPLAEKAMAEYNDAHNKFLDAQRQQYGDVQTG